MRGEDINKSTNETNDFMYINAIQSKTLILSLNQSKTKFLPINQSDTRILFKCWALLTITSPNLT